MANSKKKKPSAAKKAKKVTRRPRVSAKPHREKEKKTKKATSPSSTPAKEKRRSGARLSKAAAPSKKATQAKAPAKKKASKKATQAKAPAKKKASKKVAAKPKAPAKKKASKKVAAKPTKKNRKRVRLPKPKKTRSKILSSRRRAKDTVAEVRKSQEATFVSQRSITEEALVRAYQSQIAERDPDVYVKTQVPMRFGTPQRGNLVVTFQLGFLLNEENIRDVIDICVDKQEELQAAYSHYYPGRKGYFYTTFLTLAKGEKAVGSGKFDRRIEVGGQEQMFAFGNIGHGGVVEKAYEKTLSAELARHLGTPCLLVLGQVGVTYHAPKHRSGQR